MKSVWSGLISFELVNIPVEVYPAKEVPWEEVAKGFEIAKDQYVTISKQELKLAQLKTTKNMQIIHL